MRIAGFQKLSLIDYPGKIAAVVFTQGCNFRCRYCYNPQLVCPSKFGMWVEPDLVFKFLETRKGKLEGVVVSGGEPTIQEGILLFMAKLKSMGFAVKLDTNGSNPGMLDLLIKLRLVDFIAMDIKTSLQNYTKAIGVKAPIDKIEKSIGMIVNSGMQHQFRTTLVRPLCSEEDLMGIRDLIKGPSSYCLQPFMPFPDIIDRGLLAHEQYSGSEILRLQSLFQKEHPCNQP